MPVVNECKCVGGCYRLPHYREVTSDDWPWERERWEEEGEEGRESGAVGQEEGERVVDVKRCGGRCLKQCIQLEGKGEFRIIHQF